MQDVGPVMRTSEKLFNLLQEKLQGWTVRRDDDGKITLESIEINVESIVDDPQFKNVLVSWSSQDEDLGSYVLTLLKGT